jgi:hypothetical protein
VTTELNPVDHYIPGEANISQPKLRSEKMDNNKNSQINVLLFFLGGGGGGGSSSGCRKVVVGNESSVVYS